MIISQYQEADRAICGHGDFTLKPEYVRHRLSVDVWMTITEVQQQRARAACFTVPRYKMVQCGPVWSGVVISPTVPPVKLELEVAISQYKENSDCRYFPRSEEITFLFYFPRDYVTWQLCFIRWNEA